MKRRVDQLFFYKYRYVIGYSLVILLLGLVIFGARFATRGLSSGEIDSTITSHALNSGNFLSSAIINWPFKLLQQNSLALLGLSVFSVKLPAMVLAFAAGLALLWLLLKWFKPGITILTLAIAVTAGQFLYCAQSGTPNILYILYPLLILLFGLLITTGKHLYYILVPLLAITIGLSLYTPLMIYLVAVLLIVCVSQPHLRFFIKNLPVISLVLGILTFAITILPLILATMHDVGTVGLLLGKDLISFNIFANLHSVATSFLTFNTVEDSSILTPIFAMPALALIIYGVYVCTKNRYSARSYATLALGTVAAAILVFVPDQFYLITIPAFIFLAVGIETLLQNWYSLFPHNPYARIAGLVPILFLVITMGWASVEHFVYGYWNTPQVAKHYSNDITLVQRNLKPTSVIVTPKGVKYDFYKIIEDQYPKVQVTASMPTNLQSNLLVVGSSEVKTKLPLTRIVTSAMAEDADRVYIYE
ncbi:hypothetical protein FWF48_01000 [Candidatus Saccharibacteria bacterium]|nr:hypothetical protein [Candidatus Saccharibacteria bacterium]